MPLVARTPAVNLALVLLVLLIPVAILTAVSTTLVANNVNNIRLLTPLSELEEKKSTAERCPNKILKTFLIEVFFYLPQMSTTPVMHLERRISPRFFDKI